MSSDLPPLPAGWSYARLEECVQPKSITYGVVQPGVPVQDGVPIIRVNNFRENRLDFAELMKISPEIEAKYERTRLNGGEVLLTLVGSVGQVAVTPKQARGCNVARAVGVIHPLPHVSAEWIAICLRSPLSQHLLGSRANTTVQTTINLKDVRALPIPMPTAQERQRICELLLALDDRITLLRETNSTLEAIAQALFKSWFVDFDPVRAKMEGRAPEGMDEATAALFPDRFEESALGLVPRGWKVGSFSELAHLKKGAITPLNQPDIVFEHYSLPAFDSAQLPVFETGSEIKSNKTFVPEDAVLLSKLNPHIPRVWLPEGTGKNSVCSTEFLVFVPNNGAGRQFIFCLFSTDQFQASLCQLVTGTSNSHQRVKPDGVLAMPVVIPAPAVLAAFGDVTKPIFDRIGHNRQNAKTLATLRDTLLPRLISGQLRLPEVEDSLTPIQ